MQRDFPLISVIVPIYNAEVYLERCISSIVNQSYENLEILLINDCSTDRSRSICEDWSKKDARILYMEKKNSGVSATRNAGLKIAKGEYVVFVDSDDYMLPHMCRTFYQKFTENKADCVVCSILEPNNNVWGCSSDIDYTSLDALKKDYVVLQQTELLSPCWNKIYKKSLIKSYFPEDMSFGEDLVFCLDYLKQCKQISFIHDTLIFHEKENENSLVRKVDLKRLLDIEKILKKTLSFCGDNPPIQLYDKYVRDLSVYSRLYMMNRNMRYKAKVEELEIWRKQSMIGSLEVAHLSCHWKIKFLLFCLKFKLWHLFNIQVNKAALC